MGEVSLYPMPSCLTGLDQFVLQIKTKIVSSLTADSKPVKQGVNSTVILPPLVFPAERSTSSAITNKNTLAYSRGEEERFYDTDTRRSTATSSAPSTPSFKMVTTHLWQWQSGKVRLTSYHSGTIFTPLHFLCNLRISQRSQTVP